MGCSPQFTPRRALAPEKTWLILGQIAEVLNAQRNGDLMRIEWDFMGLMGILMNFAFGTWA